MGKLMRFGLAALSIAAAFLAQEARAAACTSVATGNWSAAATWSCVGAPPATVPGINDSAIIASPHTVSLGTANRSAASLTINAGATLVDNGRDLTVSGSVAINGTYDGTGNNGDLIMTGNGQTLSGTGTIVDIGRIQIDGNTTIPAGSNLNLTLDSEIRVGNNNPATLTIDGTITGTAQNNGNRIIRLDNNFTSNVIVNGTINAPVSFVEIQAGGTLTNNGAMTLQYLDGNGDATSTWTQGANSSLTFSQPAQGWTGTFNASATGNTVTYTAPATPITPSGNTYYNLAGTGVACPTPFVILGTSPCTAPPGSISVTASPTACINVAGIGTQAWGALTLTGPLASDNAYATSSVNDNQTTNYLQCTGYGFAVPANATIIGITVNVERNATNTLVRDAAMRLVKAGVIQATDRSTATNYTTTDVTEAHGGISDLWGGAWTPTDINAATFGAALASRKAGTTGGARTARVDHMPITVTYTIPAYGPHHIEIQHDGNGLTCSAETVTIRACADASVPCNTLYTAGGLSVTLAPGGQTFTIDITGINNAASVQQSSAGAATLGASSVPAAANPEACWNTAASTASCAMTFSDSGFIVTVPDHVSCNNASATIGSGSCAPAYQNTTRAVNLFTAYTSPATGTMAATASTDGGTTWSTVSTSAPGTVWNLAFNASGTATILLNYQDAGRLTLNAAGTAPTGAPMSGSGTFVAAPASFAFGGIPAAPLTAGQAFNATVTARNACTTPATTPNFTGQTVTITSSNPQPSLGNATSINTSLTATGGAGSINLTWNEVGTVDLNANLSNYLGSALSINGVQTGVGQFKPAYFDTAVVATATTPMPCPTGLSCPAPYDGFVYSGQPFSVNVTAKNLAGGTTANYNGTSGLSKTVTLSAWNAKGGATQNPGPGALNGNIIAPAAFVSGEATATDTPTYTFNTSPTSPTDIYVRAVDTDNVTSLRATPADSVEGGVKIVSGRAKIGNAHGSELLSLPMAATVQYYNGTNWVTSATDSVTSLMLGLTNYQCKTGCPWTTTPTPAGGQPIAGALAFRLSPPTGGGTGSVEASISAPPYLLTGSNGGGVNPSIAGRATFGVYKGSNEFIYLRENY